MPIHSPRDRGDHRVVCGLLAKEVLAKLDVEHDQQARSSFINFIRLLDTYRHDAFRSRRQRGVLKRSDHAPKRPAAVDTIPKVRQALDAAHREVFGPLPKAEVVDFLIRALEPCFQRDQPIPPPGDLETTKRFIESLLRHLQGN